MNKVTIPEATTNKVEQPKFVEITFYHRSLNLIDKIKYKESGHKIFGVIVDSDNNVKGVKCRCCKDCCHPVNEDSKIDYKKRTGIHHGALPYSKFKKEEKKRKKSLKHLTPRVMEIPLRNSNEKKKSNVQQPNIEMV